jgi:hypothetical protein
MATIKVSQRDLYAAMHELAETPHWTGYLNRRTGEILHFVVDCPNPADWVSSDAEIDFVFDRARIDAEPADWVEIPKAPAPGEFEHTDEETDAQFNERVTEFFHQHGIDAELV